MDKDPHHSSATTKPTIPPTQLIPQDLSAAGVRALSAPMADQRRPEAAIEQLEARIAEEERHTRCVVYGVGRRLEGHATGISEAGEGLGEASREEEESLARVERAVEGLKKEVERLRDVLRGWEGV